MYSGNTRCPGDPATGTRGAQDWYKVRMAHRITRGNLGAWLLRCNPGNEPDLPRLIARGGHRIERWCVAGNYRSRMMAAGDPIVFWVSGDGRRLVRGIWGIGRVLGVDGLPQPADHHTAPNPGSIGLDRRPRVSVDIPLLPEGVSDAALRDWGINDLEVQVQPQGSNPSWISTGQLARLIAVVPSLLVPTAVAPGRPPDLP
jgi:hypothetical protein